MKNNQESDAWRNRERGEEKHPQNKRLRRLMEYLLVALSLGMAAARGGLIMRSDKKKIGSTYDGLVLLFCR